MKNVAVVLLAGILISSSAFSQKKSKELMPVKGKVTAFDHFSISNAEVISKKTKTTTLTDSLGRFEIMSPQGDMLTFNANGFEKSQRKVNKDADPIEVNMILKEGRKNEEIAVAYGHIRKEDLTYAVSHYSDLNNDFAMYTSMEQLLQSELVGAQVLNQGGGLRVFLRGSESTTSISGMDHSALFVLDGVPADRVDHLNPKDIKTITLLKGSEANMYGSRGSHGAVLIETK
jgi:TonB-dependent SusC/RagA subfamily outer membrane receptor